MYSIREKLAGFVFFAHFSCEPLCLCFVIGQTELASTEKSWQGDGRLIYGCRYHRLTAAPPDGLSFLS
jgi:hypothetical protein